MTVSDISQQIFSVLSSLWSFLSSNSVLAFSAFAPVVVGSIIFIINKIR